MDMSAFVIPKSDQINADDLIAGPMTIRVARVSGTGNPEQPVAVHFDGDGSRPFKPCKSMRRVMIEAWGNDASRYAGRRMTIYRDAEVAFGGMKVGGIRISAMSDIGSDRTMFLTATKGKRAPFRVKALPDDAPARPAYVVVTAAGEAEDHDTPDAWQAAALAALAALESLDALAAWKDAMRPHIQGAAKGGGRAAAQVVSDATKARGEALARGDAWEPGATPAPAVTP